MARHDEELNKHLAISEECHNPSRYVDSNARFPHNATAEQYPKLHHAQMMSTYLFSSFLSFLSFLSFFDRSS